jgi:hypothetical protein
MKLALLYVFANDNLAWPPVVQKWNCTLCFTPLRTRGFVPRYERALGKQQGDGRGISYPRQVVA